MKRKFLSIVICLLLLLQFTTVLATGEETEETNPTEAGGLSIESTSAILIDSDSGQVLYEKNAHEELPPASVTKVMTMLLIMEELEEGNITLQDEVPVSQFAADMGGSQLFLEPNETVSVEDLLKGIAIESANDASAAMAEYIAGSYDSFVAMMNERAKELGMNESHFKNTNGLPTDGHYSSAYDIALMSRELMKYPEIHEYLTIWMTDITIGKNDDKVRTLANTNKLLRRDDRVDGIKTGYTSDAGFCLSSTAKEGSMRLISVVLDAPSSNDRFDEALKLLNFGFSQYKHEAVVEEGALMGEVEINRGVKDKVSAVTKEGYSLLLKKNEKKEFDQEIEYDKITAPVKQGDKVGQLIIKEGGKEVEKVDLVAQEDVEKLNLFDMFNRFVTNFLEL